MMQVVSDVAGVLDQLRQAAATLEHPVSFMEVCGTHTMSAFRCGLHSLLPANVTLLSGPGCPVCVTAQGDIDQIIEVADRPGITIGTYGDMLRVPGTQGSLEAARGRGADVRVVYSALDAVQLARRNPDRQVVFAAVGFETTAPATAACVWEARRWNLQNFSVLASHKRVLPALTALLAGGQVKVRGFMLPGHVSVILGSRVYQPLVEHHKIPCVIAGFEDRHIALALLGLVQQTRDKTAKLENTYPQAVKPGGNPVAQEMMARVFEPASARWRGLGVLLASGLTLRCDFREFDAREKFALPDRNTPEPAGCRCGQVITGQCTPADCRLFAKTCTPISPVGPCMVSSEGTCSAWFKYRRG